MLGLLDRGQFVPKLNAALTEALETLASQPNEKGKASLTLKIDLTYEKGMVQIVPSINSKLPESDKSGPTILFEHDGALSTQHPSQIDLEEHLREVKTVTQTA